uniref:Uncharacterized protein n=1 Tax=Lepeophtheirus salmonis TaxID=72036 RepID=A0A0K2UCB8_LEPSM
MRRCPVICILCSTTYSCYMVVSRSFSCLFHYSFLCINLKWTFYIYNICFSSTSFVEEEELLP